MRYRYPLIFAIFLILAAVSVAGCCCCTSIPSIPVTTPDFGGSTATAVPTTTTGGGTTLGSMMDFKNVHWYEYRMTSDSAGTSATMTMREDLSVDYQGKKANKFTMNMDMGAADSSMDITSYMDPSTGATLGGHMKMTAGGQVIMDQDIEPGKAPSTSSGVSTDNPLLSFEGTSLTKAGTESVTVPAGTYTATKYTWTKSGDTGNVWIASNVPVPVKMSYSSSDTTTNMELTGWG